MKTIDLHVHTTSSDGSYTPIEVVKYAVEKNLAAIAITDHDTMRGIKEAMDYIKDHNIALELIPGIEISTRDAHILGYFINKSKDELTDIIDQLEQDLNASNRSSKEALQIISKYGGISSLAHPEDYWMSIPRLDQFIKELADNGLNGVECFYTTHSDSLVSELKKIVEKYNLIYTGGTDFHGSNKLGVDLGSGYGDLKIPYEIIDLLKDVS